MDNDTLWKTYKAGEIAKAQRELGAQGEVATPTKVHEHIQKQRKQQKPMKGFGGAIRRFFGGGNNK